jgi:hypothetical protein
MTPYRCSLTFQPILRADAGAMCKHHTNPWYEPLLSKNEKDALSLHYSISPQQYAYVHSRNVAL